MAQTRKGYEGFTFKDDGRIDFSKPPKGKRFVPVMTNDNDIKELEIDRKFVTYHKFSATTMKVEMVLVDEKDAEAADAYIKDIKEEIRREERKNRCKIISPKTGKEIYCPESCHCTSDDCPMKQGLAAGPDVPESLDTEDMAEKVKSCSWSYDPTADKAMANIMWDGFKDKLRRTVPVLADIIEMDEYGYRVEEILQKLGKREDETSWYYYQWKRIRNKWKEYNEG